jgi:hypothetical protein
LKGESDMKRKVECIDISEAVLNEDFIIVSKVAMTEEYDFLPYEEGMDLSNVVKITYTLFEEGLIQHVYNVGQHVDITLAVTLGLGVVKSLVNGELYVYQMDTSSENRLDEEIVRIAMYYQIMNPDEDVKELDTILQTSDGAFYLFLLQFVDSEYPVNRLKEIFAAKKGKGNNVVKFGV